MTKCNTIVLPLRMSWQAVDPPTAVMHACTSIASLGLAHLFLRDITEGEVEGHDLPQSRALIALVLSQYATGADFLHRGFSCSCRGLLWAAWSVFALWHPQ